MRRRDQEYQNLRHTHALTPKDIGEPTKEKLTEKITYWSGNLDTKILINVQYMAMTVDISQHLRGNVDGEDIVAGKYAPISGS